MSRRWIVPLAALALLVPVGAVALDRGSGGLAVAASLESCGVADDTLVCQVSTSFDHVKDAEYYTATITRPDSTVQDFGQVAGEGDGRASVALWVSYAGNGSYAVEVTAWKIGKDGKPKEVAKDKGKPNGGPQPELLEESPAAPLVPGEEAPADAEAPALLPECDPDSTDHGDDGSSDLPGSEGTLDDQPQAPDQQGENDPSGDQGPAEGTTPENSSEDTEAQRRSPRAASSQSAPGANVDLLKECDDPAQDAKGPCCPDES